MKTFLVAVALLAVSTQAFAAPRERAVLSHYAAIAHAVYEDSLTAARGLRQAVDRLIAEPSEQTLSAARAAWKAARAPYQQSEIYCFGNAVVDEWEGKVNAWPLDEGLIDYVAASYGAESDENPGYRANVIANPSFTFSGRTIKVIYQIMCQLRKGYSLWVMYQIMCQPRKGVLPVVRKQPRKGAP